MSIQLRSFVCLRRVKIDILNLYKIRTFSYLAGAIAREKSVVRSLFHASKREYRT